MPRPHPAQVYFLSFVLGAASGTTFCACSPRQIKNAQSGIEIVEAACDLSAVALPEANEFCVTEEALLRSVRDIVSARPVPLPSASAVPLASASSSARSFALKTDPGAVAATSSSARPATLRIRVRR